MGARDPGSDLLRMLGQQQALGIPSSPWDPQGEGFRASQRLAAQGTGGRPGGGTGKSAAEAYLGRSISGPEYDQLIRATHAESGQRNSPQEQAMIMGSILNRARTNPGGISGALNAPNQFQSVTGTKFNPGPSQNYRNGPSQSREASIEDAAVNLLPSVPRDQINFTAASRSAYGAGTNFSYLGQLQKTGGAVYGGTQFNTRLSGGPPLASNQPQFNAPSGGGNIFQALSGLFGGAG